MRKTSSILLLTAALILGGCANTSGDVYRRDQAMRERTVQPGVVESVRDVTLEGSRSGVGTVAGGALGGLAGSNIGHGRGSVAGAIVGAVVGGIAGHALEEKVTRETGQEITVKLDNGRTISVVQGGPERFHPGERVRVLSGQGETRVSR
ncbi:glycine zipper 2TM domain-containing protein [Azovibrio restrictus]|uniref:glycine zipper 2TM domain-containing protein n=1 Tax=Azovibrio restrictus TaxID=146938 RepID=UPI0026F315DF|nr:glycine zipper 2TM domain-containing protein [Azovibrio restrictus]